jgi:NADH dehydrogenase (ubiquinone) 1 alpha subcomplex subunit 6
LNFGFRSVEFGRDFYLLFIKRLNNTVRDYDVPLTVPRIRSKIRSEFEKHRFLTDVRLVDMLVIKVKR